MVLHHLLERDMEGLTSFESRFQRMLILCSGRSLPNERRDPAHPRLEVRVNYAINFALIIGFVCLDWLRFHDILKPEIPTGADWLTGILSLLVFYVATQSILHSRAERRLTR